MSPNRRCSAPKLTDPGFARVLEYVRDTLTDYFRFRH
jgi:hypothetical protein